MLSLKSIDIQITETFFFGKTYIIKNGTNADVTIFNMQETGFGLFSKREKDLV
jgi:hypothetical protein